MMRLYNFLIFIFLVTYVSVQSEEITKKLILTDIIKSNVTHARYLSEVHHKIFKNVSSYSGYLTVDPRYNSNLFFWFFPAQKNYQKAPVILWLQGGPGDSCLIGLFYENGPFILNEKLELENNPYSWNQNISVIYIDNPVGSGFSFTNKGYCTNQTIIGEHLYEALSQFFQLFPEISHNDFFIFGESYGGKYTVALGYTIHNKNKKTARKINLKGLSIGNGIVDPQHEISFGDYYYQLGLIDRNVKEQIQNQEKVFVEQVKDNKYIEALETMCRIYLGTDSIFMNASGFKNNMYNFLQYDFGVNLTFIRYFTNIPKLRDALHVGDTPYRSGNSVMVNLYEEMMTSLAPWLSKLLNHYRVIIYNGQLDLIVPYPVTLNYIYNLNFSSAEEYKSAKRFIWRVENDIAGYVKYAKNLTEVMVRNAGHMAIHDQPKWMFELMQKFVQNRKIH